MQCYATCSASSLCKVCENIETERQRMWRNCDKAQVHGLFPTSRLWNGMHGTFASGPNLYNYEAHTCNLHMHFELKCTVVGAYPAPIQLCLIQLSRYHDMIVRRSNRPSAEISCWNEYAIQIKQRLFPQALDPLFMCPARIPVLCTANSAF
jgi:hypothetical protein